MKILIVEDDKVTRKLLQHRLEKWGYAVTAAADGLAAWEEFRRETFPMVISDWMMPGLDGLELVRRIRAFERPGYVYTILLTARTGREDILAGMAAGADDFITKPFDPEELHARIKVGARITRLEQELEKRNRELEKANRRMKRDLEAAARIQRALLPARLPRCPGVEFAWKYEPCEELAGDTLNLFFLDENHIGLYLLDVSGHGVPAALLSVSLSRIMSPDPEQSDLLKDPCPEAPGGYCLVEPAEVANRLNRRFPLDERTGQYFTFQYARLEIATRTLTFVSAGHPPMIHLRADGSSQTLLVRSLPIGFKPEAEKLYRDRTLKLEPGDRFYLYSDGILEAAAPESREMFGIDRLRKTLERARNLPLAASLEAVCRDLEAWTRSSRQADDISLLALEITP
jgi:sigma-B regulation protein RsbU (phosphoserine phosphatase)